MRKPKRTTNGELTSGGAGARRATRCLAVALIVAACDLNGCAQPAPPPDRAVAQGAENRLRVGDELLVRLDKGNTQGPVTAAPETITVSVDEHGEISLPLVGRV